MIALREAPPQRQRRILTRAVFALAFVGSQALAQTTVPPGFESVPRPPGAVGGGQTFMPPGAGAGVLPPPPSMMPGPTVANPNPLQIGPPAPQPVALPPAQAAVPPPAAVAPAV